jgi:hypothetical protein
MNGRGGKVAGIALALGLVAPALSQQAGGSNTMYRCPGPTVEYTNRISPQEAQERGCKPVEGQPITVIQGRSPGPPRGAAASDAAARPAETRVDPAAQRARDSDARRILQAELRREEERLAELKREYNNGEPERRGDERNYQKYLDRVADLKAGITRKEGDVAAIRRELAKLPPP